MGLPAEGHRVPRGQRVRGQMPQGQHGHGQSAGHMSAAEQAWLRVAGGAGGNAPRIQVGDGSNEHLPS